jgi:hydroxypyruvate isomerase
VRFACQPAVQPPSQTTAATANEPRTTPNDSDGITDHRPGQRTYQLSANLEWLLTEATTIPQRIRAAAAAGLPAVEIWTWRDKDLDGINAALHDTGLVLQTMCTEPMGQLVDPQTHPLFLDGLRESVEIAVRLNCPYLVVTAGDNQPGVPRQNQRAAVIDALRHADGILAEHQVTLLLENLNSRIDHPDTFLDATADVISILREVASPSIKLLFDAYHASVMNEDLQHTLTTAGDLLAHIQIADTPGRHEPGSGTIDWPATLATFNALGYRGRLGLEYQPTVATLDSLMTIKRLTSEPTAT